MQEKPNSPALAIERARATDFKKIFLITLASVAPISKDRRQYKEIGLEALGIREVVKEIPAMIFFVPDSGQHDYEGEGHYEMWAVNPAEIKDKFEPHYEVTEKLAKLLDTEMHPFERELKYNLFGGKIIVDDNDKLYLLIDEIRAEELESKMKTNEKRILDLLVRYKINKVVGKFWRTRKIGNDESSGNEYEMVVDEDIIGKRRENTYLLKLARENGLSNSQFMRFRARAISAKEANEKIAKQNARRKKKVGYIPVDYDKIIKEILEEGG